MRQQTSGTLLLVAIALGTLVAPGCAGASQRLSHGGVAFVIGYSTDPYGNSESRGFGVATSLIAGRLQSVEDSTQKPLAVGWLGSRRLVVSKAVGLESAPAAMFELRSGRLEQLSPPPLRPGDRTFAWSPNRKLIAIQPSVRVPCGPGTRPGLVCTTSARAIFVEHSDGGGRHRVTRGLLRGWTPDGHLLLFTGPNAEFSSGAFMALDVRSSRERTVLSSRQVGLFVHRRAALGDLAYSADRRYLAARLVLSRLSGVVIARANGRIVRLITSRDTISMFAWSPHGHQLVYTTSGFPAPHELYMLSSPDARPRRILSQAPHFDWVTWSPDDRWLLIDNEHLHAWDLLHLTGHRRARLLGGPSVPSRRLPRLGGMPLWCCPQQSYGGT